MQPSRKPRSPVDPEGSIGIGTANPEYWLHVASPTGETIVTITPDGRVNINPKYTLDDAALAFWNAVKGIKCPNCGFIHGAER